MGIGNIVSWLKSYYDKLITFVVFLVLVASLIYLAVRIGLMKGEQAQFLREISNMKIVHEHVQVMNTEFVDEARQRLENPFQIPMNTWTNRMFVPEARVRCPECRRPAPYDALKCPSCGASMPQDIGPGLEDTDKDGMPDEWEKKYNLDPFDPSDANKDADGDGFTNLQEYLGGTNPRDASDHPTWESLLRVEDVRPDLFRLKFKGVQRMGDDSLRFQLNLRNNEKTHFVKMNEDVEEVFKVVKYESKTTNVWDETLSKDVAVDVSELTLQRGDKMILLIKGKDVRWDECIATLVFEMDKSSYRVRTGDSIELNVKEKKMNYLVNKIDLAGGSVVLRRSDNEVFVIRKTLAIESKDISE
jgi:hypothetical protein